MSHEKVHPKAIRDGFSLVELVFGLLLFVLLTTFIYRTVRVQSLSWYTVEKLESLQTLRIAEKALRSQLEPGYGVLFPVTGQDESPLIVYADSLNRLRTIYRTSGGELHLREYGSDEVEKLCSGVEEFSVSRLSEDIVVCKLTVRVNAGKTKDDEQFLHLDVPLYIGNPFCGNGESPP